MRSAEKWGEEEMNASGEDKRTLVVGLGVTGLSVARFLASRGDETLVIDSRARPPGLEALRQDQSQISIVLESLDVRWLAANNPVGEETESSIVRAEMREQLSIRLAQQLEYWSRQLPADPANATAP